MDVQQEQASVFQEKEEERTTREVLISKFCEITNMPKTDFERQRDSKTRRKMKKRTSCVLASTEKVKQLSTFLSKHLYVQDLFSIKEHNSSALKDRLDAGVDMESGVFQPHDAAHLLKTVLRELPEPLLTHRHFRAHMKVADMTVPHEQGNEAAMIPDKEAQIEALQLLFLILPQANRDLLKLLLDLLSDAAKQQDKNNMSCQRLAKEFAPCILLPKYMSEGAEKVSDELETKMVEVVAFLIEHAERLFKRPSSLTRDGEGVPQTPLAPKQRKKTKAKSRTEQEPLAADQEGLTSLVSESPEPSAETEVVNPATTHVLCEIATCSSAPSHKTGVIDVPETSVDIPVSKDCSPLAASPEPVLERSAVQLDTDSIPSTGPSPGGSQEHTGLLEGKDNQPVSVFKLVKIFDPKPRLLLAPKPSICEMKKVEPTQSVQTRSDSPSFHELAKKSEPAQTVVESKLSFRQLVKMFEPQQTVASSSPAAHKLLKYEAEPLDCSKGLLELGAVYKPTPATTPLSETSVPVVEEKSNMTVIPGSHADFEGAGKATVIPLRAEQTALLGHITDTSLLEAVDKEESVTVANVVPIAESENVGKLAAIQLAPELASATAASTDTCHDPTSSSVPVFTMAEHNPVLSHGQKPLVEAKVPVLPMAEHNPVLAPGRQPLVEAKLPVLPMAEHNPVLAPGQQPLVKAKAPVLPMAEHNPVLAPGRQPLVKAKVPVFPMAEHNPVLAPGRQPLVKTDKDLEAGVVELKQQSVLALKNIFEQKIVGPNCQRVLALKKKSFGQENPSQREKVDIHEHENPWLSQTMQRVSQRCC